MTAPPWAIHAADCDVFLRCCAHQFKTDAYSGISCDGTRHACDCSGSRMVAVEREKLERLVQAAGEVVDDAAMNCGLDSYQRISDALAPFRSETEECGNDKCSRCYTDDTSEAGFVDPFHDKYPLTRGD